MLTIPLMPLKIAMLGHKTVPAMDSSRGGIEVVVEELAAMTSSFFATVKATFGHYDVIHFHAEGPCFWMWIPAIFCKKRCVIATIHGDTGITSSREKSLFYGNDAQRGFKGIIQHSKVTFFF